MLMGSQRIFWPASQFPKEVSKPENPARERRLRSLSSLYQQEFVQDVRLRAERGARL
jgi:hypothetical protein